VFSTKIVNNGGCLGNVMQALARWRHPLASSEALVVLHRTMRPASHRRIRMVVGILLLATTISSWAQALAKILAIV
jgi:hypothetical protein